VKRDEARGARWVSAAAAMVTPAALCNFGERFATGAASRQDDKPPISG